MIEKCDRCGQEDEVVRAYGRLFCPNCAEQLSRTGAAWYLRRAVEKERERRKRGCRRER